MEKIVMDWLLKYISGTTILIGIGLLFASVLCKVLSTFGWILIIFGAIWFVMDLTLLKDV